MFLLSSQFTKLINNHTKHGDSGAELWSRTVFDIDAHMAAQGRPPAQQQQQQPPAPVAPVPGIRPPLPVCLDTNCAENWRYFKQKWLNYAVITNLDNQSRKYRVALLLHVLGDQALKIYNGFNFASTEAN